MGGGGGGSGRGGGGGEEESRPPSVGLQSLCLEHVNYHHRLAYLLACWPDVFHKLEVRKSNLDSAGPRLAEKLSHCRRLSTLVLEHCHVLPPALETVLTQLSALQGRLVLRSLTLSLLSSARHFTRADARKPGFKPSLSLACCRLLAHFLAGSPTLTELTLCHDAIDDVKLRVLAGAASRSASLTSLDLTGNVIGDDACEDVATLLVGHRKLSTLLLHENSFSSDGRRVLIDSAADRDSLKLSL